MLFWIIFLFLVGIVGPFSTLMVSMPPETEHEIFYLSGALVLAVIGGRLLLGVLGSRRRSAVARPPDPKRVATLDWPRSISRGEMEAYCAAFLRQDGWTVTLGRSPLDGATFVTAERDGARVVLLCDLAGEELNPAIIRGFAQAGPVFGDAHPVVVTRLTGRLPHPAQQAAAGAGVRLLRVADLKQIGTMAAEAAPAGAG